MLPTEGNFVIEWHQADRVEDNFYGVSEYNLDKYKYEPYKVKRMLDDGVRDLASARHVMENIARIVVVDIPSLMFGGQGKVLNSDFTLKYTPPEEVDILVFLQDVLPYRERYGINQGQLKETILDLYNKYPQ
jgi:hypothetical protein